MRTYTPVRWQLPRFAQQERVAFASRCAELRTACERVVNRTLSDAEAIASPHDIAHMVELACERAWAERHDRPCNWSTYGWLTWMAQREAIMWLQGQER